MPVSLDDICLKLSLFSALRKSSFPSDFIGNPAIFCS